MIQTELFSLIKTLGYPTAYHHFIVDDDNPPPIPPYITYLRISDKNISSDAKVHGKIKLFQVELYTVKKDVVCENKIEEMLESIDSEYETSEDYIESESLYQVVYQIKIIERRETV